ncbi:MAG: hypothetical protein EHM34_04090 [Nitrosopumilales archaeon]|nr:MAG: hypothetical protein EHM34_04090 [Nitrosopumilales archaeon]
MIGSGGWVQDPIEFSHIMISKSNGSMQNFASRDYRIKTESDTIIYEELSDESCKCEIDIHCINSFLHTYIIGDMIDEDCYTASLFNLTSKDYKILTESNFIYYEALDGSHEWRICLTREPHNNFRASIRHLPGQIFERDMELM